LGLGVVVAIAYWIAIIHLDFSVTVAFLLGWVGYSTYVALKNLSSIRNDLAKSSNEIVLMLALFSLVYYVLMYPALRSGNLEAILGYNGDFTTGASIAESMRWFNMYSKVPVMTSYYIPVYSYNFIQHGPKAFLLLVALSSAISQARSYTVYTVLSAFVTSLAIPSIYLFGRSLGLRGKLSAFLAFFVMTSPTLVWFYLDDFPIQLLAFSILPIALILADLALETQEKGLIYASSILTALVVASHTMVAFIYLTSVCVLLVPRIFGKNRRNTLMGITKMGVLTIMINIPASYDLVVNAVFQSTAKAGNILQFPSLGALLGVYPILDFGFSRYVPTYAQIALELSILVLVALGLLEGLKRRPPIILALFLSVFFYLLVTWLVRYPYVFAKAFPVGTLALTSLALLYVEKIGTRLDIERLNISRLALKSSRARVRAKQVISLGLIILVLGGAFGASMSMTSAMIASYSDRGVMERQLVEFYHWLEVAMPQGSKVFFLSGYSQSFWARYFLVHGDVFAPNDVYVGRQITEDQMILQSDVCVVGTDRLSVETLREIASLEFEYRYVYTIHRQMDEQGLFLAQDTGGWGPTAFLVFSRYGIPILEEYACRIQGPLTGEKNGLTRIVGLMDGWYGVEGSTSGYFRWTEQNATILAVVDTKTSAELVLETVWPVGNNSVAVYANNVLLSRAERPLDTIFRFVIPKNLTSGGFILLRLSVKDTFVPDEVLHNGDLRRLGIAVKRIVVENENRAQSFRSSNEICVPLGQVFGNADTQSEPPNTWEERERNRRFDIKLELP